MPTGKRRPRPQKKKVGTRAGFNLKQLRKKIDELKKKLERHASNTDKPPAQSTSKHHAAELSSNPKTTTAREAVLDLDSEAAAKPEGKRELARRMMLARIAEARNQRANRSAEASQVTERSKD